MPSNYTRRINIWINGEEVKHQISDIKNSMSKLINEQARMTIGSRDYVQHASKIRNLKTIIQQHNNDLNVTAKGWGNLRTMADAMNKYFLVVSSFIAGFGGLLMGGKKAISMFAEFDDVAANVTRTTGLATEEVYAMNESLKKVDTRTGQQDLLSLGVIAGKLGVAKEDVEGFVKAADKINVALSGALGADTEESINQIGKLVNIFKVSDEFGIEKGMLKVGSAINSLGLASTANEGYIVEFAKRVGGIAPTAGISIQSVLGLAATLDQLGQTSEVSSTVYSQVITGMFKKTGEYAKIAGIETKTFADLLKNDANEAFIKVMEGLKGNNEGMDRLVGLMGDLGLDGKRSVQVLGVLSNNTGLLREQQDMSNKSYKEGTSILDAFNIRNTSAQAKLEKNRKVLTNMTIELGQKLLPVLTVSTSGFSYFVKFVSLATDVLLKYSGVIIPATVAVVTYTLSTKLATMWSNKFGEATLLETIILKAKTLATNAGIAATQLYAAVTMLLSGNIAGAAQAMRVFNTVMKGNIVGMLATVILTAAAALYIYAKRHTEAAEAARKHIKAIEETATQLDKEKSLQEILIKQAKNENLQKEKRLWYLNQLKEASGGYLDNLTLENISTKEGASLLDTYNKSLERRIWLEGNMKELTDIIEQKRKSERERYGIDGNGGTATALSAKKKERDDYAAKHITTGNAYTVKKDEYASQLDQEYKILLEKDTKVLNHINTMNLMIGQLYAERQTLESKYSTAIAPIIPPDDSNAPPVNPNALDEPDKGKKTWSLNNDLNFLKDKEKIKNDFIAGTISSEEEFNQKILALEINSLEARIKTNKDKGTELLDLLNELADKKLQRISDVKKREEALQKAANEGLSDVEKEKAEYDDRLKELGIFGKKREDLTALELRALEGLEKQHQEKIDKLDGEAIEKEVTRLQTTAERELTTLKLQHAKELVQLRTLEDVKVALKGKMSDAALSKITTFERGKNALVKIYQVEEQDLARKHLEELQALLEKAFDTGMLDNVVLGDQIFSEEEKDKILKYIDELKNAIAELKGSTESAPTGFADKLGASMQAAFGNSTDILGFTPKQWEESFDNLNKTEGKITAIAMGIQGLANAYKYYADYANAREQSILQEFEESTNAKKELLQQQLDRGAISQEAYTAKVKVLDNDYQKKKEDGQRKAANRAKAMAITQAIINTAVAVTSALTVVPPLGYVLAGISGAMGLAEIAIIAATPGYEKGGFTQKDANNKKPVGVVHANEYVVPSEGLKNPQVRRVLDVIEMARQNDNLAHVNLDAILSSTNSKHISAFENGGYTTSKPKTGSSSTNPDRRTEKLLEHALNVIQKFNKKLDEGPLTAIVALRGKKGLYETMEDDTNLKNNANM